MVFLNLLIGFSCIVMLVFGACTVCYGCKNGEYKKASIHGILFLLLTIAIGSLFTTQIAGSLEIKAVRTVNGRYEVDIQNGKTITPYHVRNIRSKEYALSYEILTSCYGLLKEEIYTLYIPAEVHTLYDADKEPSASN